MPLFEKGHSGNPKGKPPGALSLKSLLVQELRRGGREKARQVIEATIQDAISGPAEVRARARQLIWEYIDGKVPTPLELGGHDGNAMEHIVTVVYGDRDTSIS